MKDRRKYVRKRRQRGHVGTETEEIEERIRKGGGDKGWAKG